MERGGRERKARQVPRGLRRLGLIVAAGLPLALTPGTPHAALVDWLVLLVDVSPSIDADEYRLQREAYVNVLQDQSIGALLEGASITIVEFANRPELVVAWTADPVAAASSYFGHARRIVGPGPGSTTGIARALKLALDLLEDKAGRRIIDISGDGPDNVDWFLGVWSQRDRARAADRDQRPGDSDARRAEGRSLLCRERHHGIPRDLARARRLRARAADEDAPRDCRHASG